jgi:heavy metal sensor kinase
LIRRVEQGDSVPYVIQIISPMDQLDTAMHQLNGVLLHLIPFALIFSILGGAFLTGRSLKPVGKMAAAAENINAQSLSQRLPGESGDELGRLAAVFNRMLGRLENSFENQRRFTADASHELRTPLTALKANTSLALSPGASTEDMKTALVAADKAADRMSRLVNDLLFLSRSDSGQLEPRMELVCVNSVAETVAKMLEAQASAESISVAIDAQLGVEAYADEHLLERLLINLVTNALRHTEKGGRVQVRVQVREPGVPMVQVSDNGCGISAEHLPHIFERFYSIDESRTGEGTGLGLAISKSIADAMGAQIEVQSQAGFGSTFTIVLQRPPL